MPYPLLSRGFDVAPPISFVPRLDVTRCSSFAVPLFFQRCAGQVPARVYSRTAICPFFLSFFLPLCRRGVARRYRRTARPGYLAGVISCTYVPRRRFRLIPRAVRSLHTGCDGATVTPNLLAVENVFRGSARVRKREGQKGSAG